jgi:3-oxoacyl-[acyl-carrier protein] reductase
MKLGLEGRTAVVCASSDGLGKACATSLAREGCAVIINGRDPERLQAAADEIRSATGATVKPVRADLNTEAGRSALAAAGAGASILINNNAGPEPGPFLGFEREDWEGAMEANFYAPVFMIKALLPGMRARKFGRIVNITSARVKSPTPTMALSTAPRAGLTALARSLALDVAIDNVTVNNLLPERFATQRQVEMAHRMVKERGISYDEAIAAIAETIAAKRLGKPEEFGDTCAFLCSMQAGYISGQNLQLDGGSYRGLI